MVQGDNTSDTCPQGYNATKTLTCVRADLKPANIMVAKQGAAWQATLIDVGLAHFTPPGHSAPCVPCSPPKHAIRSFLGAYFNCPVHTLNGCVSSAWLEAICFQIKCMLKS